MFLQPVDDHIREVDGSSSHDSHVIWQWKTSSGWKDYDQEASNVIEKAYQDQEMACTIFTVAGEYQVNIAEGYQQSLTDSKLRRQVQRKVSGNCRVIDDGKIFSSHTRLAEALGVIDHGWVCHFNDVQKGDIGTKLARTSTPVDAVAIRLHRNGGVVCIGSSGVVDEVEGKGCKSASFMPPPRIKSMAKYESQSPVMFGKGKGRGKGRLGRKMLHDMPQFPRDPGSSAPSKHLWLGEKSRRSPMDVHPLNFVVPPGTSEADARAAVYRMAVEKANDGEILQICEAVRRMNLNQHDSGLQPFLVAAAQKIVNGTYKAIWTHDRKKRAQHNEDRPEDTPTKFQVISVDIVTEATMQLKYERARRRLCKEDPVLDLHLPATAKYAGGSVAQECNEWMLFHGTSPQNAQSIRNSNFKIFNEKEASRKLLCGAGFYFTESPTKADEYSSPDKSGDDRVFVLCRVLGGRVHYTEEEFPDRDELKTILNTGTCNSVLNDRERFRGTYKEFVVVRPEQVLPECLIKYRRVY